MGGVPPDPARPPDLGLGRRISVEVERTVDAPMERVWAVPRDYRVARPRLLTEHFSNMQSRRANLFPPQVTNLFPPRNCLIRSSIKGG